MSLEDRLSGNVEEPTPKGIPSPKTVIKLDNFILKVIPFLGRHVFSLFFFSFFDPPPFSLCHFFLSFQVFFFKSQRMAWVHDVPWPWMESRIVWSSQGLFLLVGFKKEKRKGNWVSCLTEFSLRASCGSLLKI